MGKQDKNIIKKELIESVKKWALLLFKIEEFEKNFYGTENELICNDEYGKLLDKSSEARAEVYRQIIDAKHYVLGGMIDIQKRILKILEDFRKDDKKNYENQIARIMDRKFLMEEKNIKKRFGQVEQLLITTETTNRIDVLYEQAVGCYINGNFDACCVMCRGIIERALKELCGEKFKAKGKLENYSLQDLIDFSRKYNILKIEALNLADRVKVLGNNSIHSKLSTNDQNAIDTIKNTQNFLKTIL